MAGFGSGSTARRALAAALLPAAGLALLALLCGSAWVGEDVLITYRSIDHWLAGDGLRYNVDERVQSYTHPLWMLLNTAVYAALQHRYWAPTALGLACSMGAWALLAHRHRARPAVALGVLTAGWALSPVLVTWSTSGFENPLTFLLLAAFVRVLLDAPADAPPPWTPLLALAGLAAVNRLDSVLLYAPALAGLLLAAPRSLPLRAVLAGAVPVLAWALPSLLYFGFVLPNTAPAKLAAGIPAATYARHGLLYLLDTLQRDPVASAAVLAALGVGVLAARRGPSGRRLALLAGGVLAYVLYTVRIGGCFLSGRFLAAPALLSLAVLAERPPALLAPAGLPLRARLASLGRVALLLAAVGGAGLATRPLTEGSRVLALPLARAELGLDARWHESDWARRYAERGIEARQRLERGDPVTAQLALGFTGIAAGLDAVLVDRFALADPLLARLPAVTGEPFLAGHAKRVVPRGYLRARRTGSLSGMDPELAAYYARLRLVVAGPLWDPARLRTIADFHLGRLRPPAR